MYRQYRERSLSLRDSTRQKFTRKSPLGFERMVRILLGMGGKSISLELLENFQHSEDTPTASAFVQRRSELLPNVMETLFSTFTGSFQYENTYRQFRLLAVDGSDVQVPTNPNDPDSYFPGSNGQKPYNLLHLNALYDLLNGVYLDAIVKKRRLAREKVAFGILPRLWCKASFLRFQEPETGSGVLPLREL